MIILDNGTQIEAAAQSIDFAGGLRAYQIAPGAVAIEIPAGGITAAMIEDGTITAAKIAPGAITVDKIADNSISTAKVVDGAITPEKLDRTYLTTIGGSSIAPIFAEYITANPGVQTISSGVTDTIYNNTVVIPDTAIFDVEVTAYLAMTASTTGSAPRAELRIRNSSDNTTLVTSGEHVFNGADWSTTPFFISLTNQRNVTLRFQLRFRAVSGVGYYLHSSMHVRAWPRANSG